MRGKGEHGPSCGHLREWRGAKPQAELRHRVASVRGRGRELKAERGRSPLAANISFMLQVSLKSQKRET